VIPIRRSVHGFLPVLTELDLIDLEPDARNLASSLRRLLSLLAPNADPDILVFVSGLIHAFSYLSLHPFGPGFPFTLDDTIIRKWPFLAVSNPVMYSSQETPIESIIYWAVMD